MNVSHRTCWNGSKSLTQPLMIEKGTVASLVCPIVSGGGSGASQKQIIQIENIFLYRTLKFKVDNVDGW